MTILYFFQWKEAFERFALSELAQRISQRYRAKKLFLIVFLMNLNLGTN
jgi:hypothetical protein